MVELEALGHRGVAVELPGEDPEAGLDDYAEAADAALTEAGVAEEVTVVGHSLGGVTVPLLPALRPVNRLVYLCAFVPRPGVSVADEFAAGAYQLTSAGRAGRATDELGRTYWVDRRRAIESLYNDCAPEVAATAAARLRPQAQRSSQEPHPLTEWPDVASAYIHCTDDRAFGELGLRLASERLGIEPHRLVAGHMPMLSRPAELARLLVELA